MFTKPRRFSACSAPAFVQRAVRPGQLGFFVESSGSVNLLRMERTSLRASSSTCFLRSCHQNLLQWNDVLFIRSQPLLLRRCNKVCEIRGHRSCAFESRMLSLQVHVAKVTKSQYTKIPWRAARSLQLSHSTYDRCAAWLLPAFNLHSFSTQRHVPCCSCRARPQPLELSGGTLAQRPALLQV